MQQSFEDILSYWLEELQPEQWYKQDDTIDAMVRSRFGEWLEIASNGGLAQWQSSSRGMLALIILTDQFPRNIFRNDPRAFAYDHIALAAARRAITLQMDQEISPPARQFFFMPFMHSESLMMQERGVRLFMTRMPGNEHNLLHARAHRQVIREFGRFPYRNAALERHTTARERSFLEEGGYGVAVRAVGG